MHALSETYNRDAVLPSMGTVIKYLVPNLVRPSFVIFDIRAAEAQLRSRIK